MVQRIRDGDDNAFEELLGRYQQAIFSVCYRYVRNEADARELTQDVFLRAYRRLPQFRGEAKFFTWLYRIAVNACLSFIRRERRAEPANPAPVAAHGDLDRQVRMKIALDRAIGALPPRQRLVFILRHYEGCSFDEVASIMGITSGAAKANHHHAVRKLRTALEAWA